MPVIAVNVEKPAMMRIHVPTISAKAADASLCQYALKDKYAVMETALTCRRRVNLGGAIDRVRIATAEP